MKTFEVKIVKKKDSPDLYETCHKVEKDPLDFLNKSFRNSACQLPSWILSNSIITRSRTVLLN